MKNITLIIFLLVIAAQIFIPAQMIWSSEKILSEGQLFKFKTMPIDPNDPFRGKYVTLRFAEANFKTDTFSIFSNKKIKHYYALIDEDNNGFATFNYFDTVQPYFNQPFIPVTVNNVYKSGDSLQIRLTLPFERFYMEENKAPIAEKTFREANADQTKNTYALVRVRNGEAILEDVQIDGLSLNNL